MPEQLMSSRPEFSPSHLNKTVAAAATTMYGPYSEWANAVRIAQIIYYHHHQSDYTSLIFNRTTNQYSFWI